MVYKYHNDFEEFWCHLLKGPDFKYYKVIDVSNDNIWEARKDGIYISEFRYIQNQAVFVFAWDAPNPNNSTVSSRGSSLGSSSISLKLLVLFSFMSFGI